MLERLDRRAVNIITALLLGCSVAVAVAWFVSDHWPSNAEPVMDLFGFGAGIFGLFVDRRIDEAERRDQVLTVLRDELARNRDFLDSDSFRSPDDGGDDGPRRFPLLQWAAANAAMLSGSLSDPKDAPLLSAVSVWQTAALELNHTTNLIEVITFGTPDQAGQFTLALFEPQSVLSDARLALTELEAALGPGKASVAASAASAEPGA
jgi:hypothetical protein